MPGANDCHSPIILLFEGAAQVQDRWRLVDIFQATRISLVIPSQYGNLMLLQAFRHPFQRNFRTEFNQVSDNLLAESCLP